MSLPSYPKIRALGDRSLRNLLLGPVTVEEKIDGSQFSFGVQDGQLLCRSKGRQIDIEAPDALFASAVATCRRLAPQLPEGWVFRGECLKAPRHNVLAYNRVPEGNVILFEVQTGPRDYLTHSHKALFAKRIGLEVVPLIHEGTVNSSAEFHKFLDRESVLGGPKMEGVVVKRYDPLAEEPFLVGKLVSDAFKETRGEKIQKKPQSSERDILLQLYDRYRVEARWQKAVQRLREAGELKESPADIGPIVRSVQADIEEECAEEIKDILYFWARKHVAKGAVEGLALWYKAQLIRENDEAAQ